MVARMRLRIPLLLLSLAFWIPGIRGQLTVDEGFWDACNQTKSVFSRRAGRQATTGDTCEMKFNVAVKDQADADEFCELYAPWRLHKAEIVNNGRPRVTCHVEATFTCHRGWMQMFGYCFRMPNKRMTATFDEAKDICATEGGEIAYMHHRYIIGVWRRYFHGVGQIWVNASETWDKYVQNTSTVDGPELALAFTGRQFNFMVPANSLIRIKPDIKLQVLCQYKPKITPAEISYLGRRYSEIYYPAIPVDNGILVRSASSYTRSSENLKVCRKTLAPYMSYVAGPFYPGVDELAALSRTRPELTWLTRSSDNRNYTSTMFSPEDMPCTEERAAHEQEQPSQVELPPEETLERESGLDTFPPPPPPGRSNDLKPIFMDFNVTAAPDTAPQCFGKSSALTLFPNQDAQLLPMSDSRSFPIWCKLGHQVNFSYTYDEEYTPFERENGEVVTHKVVKQKMNYTNAKEYCMSEGALVSGVNSHAEAEALKELAIEAGVKDDQLYLGGKRNEECTYVNGFDTNSTTGKCSRNKVIQWQHNVATAFYDDWWKDGNGHVNPSYWQGKQNCLTFVVGNPKWASNISKGFLDDVMCEQEFYFFCTKDVNYTETVVWEKKKEKEEAYLDEETYLKERAYLLTRTTLTF